MRRDLNNSDQDMLAEYDFSGGTRGKYAARLRTAEGAEPPWVSTAAFLDAQTWIREALWHTQALEATLVTYLALAFKLKPQDAGAETSALLEGAGARIFSQLIRDLRRHTSVSPDLETKLAELLKERNWLVHRSLHQYTDLSSPSAAKELVSRLEAIAGQARSLNEEISRLLEERFTKRGMTKAELEEKVKEVKEEWLAA